MLNQLTAAEIITENLIRERPNVTKSKSNLSSITNRSISHNRSLIPRPKSASNCSDVSVASERRPWTNSVLIERKPTASALGKFEAKPNLSHRLGHIPAYIRKQKSTTSIEKLKANHGKHKIGCEDRISLSKMDLQQFGDGLKNCRENSKLIESQNQYHKKTNLHSKCKRNCNETSTLQETHLKVKGVSNNSYCLIRDRKKANTKLNLYHKLGHIPLYIRKQKSAISIKNPTDDEENLNKHVGHVTSSVSMSIETDHSKQQAGNSETSAYETDCTRNTVFQQLEEELQALREKYRILEVQNQCVSDDSYSWRELIEEERLRNKQLEDRIREISEELFRQHSELPCEEQSNEPIPSRDELEKQIESLLAENKCLKEKIDALLVEIESLRKEIDKVSSRLSNVSAEQMEYSEQSENKKKSSIEKLEKYIEKYQASRLKLKGIIQDLITENNRLRAMIGSHSTEGGLIGEKENAKDGQHIGHSGEGEIINRTDYFDNLRNQKRKPHKVIEVKKYMA